MAWLFNVRGSDVAYSPVAHAYAIVTLSAAFFYVDKRKVSSEVRLYTVELNTSSLSYLSFLVSSYYHLQVGSYMEKSGIEVRDYCEVSSDTALLASDQLMSTKTAEYDATKTGSGGNNSSAEEQSNDLVWVDPGACFALYSKLNPDKVFLQSSPLALAKALKVFCSLRNTRAFVTFL